MRAFKKFVSRFGFFSERNNNSTSYSSISQQDGNRFFPFLSKQFQAIFNPNSDKHNGLRLIAPSKPETLIGLPQFNAINLNNLSELSQCLSQTHQRGSELATLQAKLKDCNYDLLFKGTTPIQLKIVNSWSDIPLLTPIKNSLTKLLGDLLTPLQKICFPSILSGENHVIQHETDETARMLFLIPAFMKLLQIDQASIPKNQVQVLILAKDKDQVDTVSSDMKNLQGVFSEGFKQAEQFNSHVVVDTPKNVMAQIKENKLDLSAVKYFVVSDLTAMSEMGFAEDIIGVNAQVAVDRQVIIVSSKIQQDSVVIEQLASRCKEHVFVFSQFAEAMLKDYALKASFWTIMMLLGAVGYLTYRLRKEGKETNKEAKK